MKTKIKVTFDDGMSPQFFTGCEIHISSHGVLCIKKGYQRYIKTFATGKWATAEEVSV